MGFSKREVWGAARESCPIYNDGWLASTKVMRAPWDHNVPKVSVLDYPWELYNLNKDWTQFEDVAAQNPEKLKEMKELFWKEAEKYQVLPLNADIVGRLWLSLRWVSREYQ